MRCYRTIFDARVGPAHIRQKMRQDTFHQTRVFNPLEFEGHVVHFGASGVPNVDALFFMLVWAGCGFHNKHVGTHYAKLVFLHLIGSAGHVVPFQCIRGVKRGRTIFHARVGSMRIRQDVRRDTLWRTCVFQYGGICGSCTFHDRDAWRGFHKKRVGTCYAEVLFLHLLGSVGHVVHSGASGARNVDAQFFMLGWAWCGFHKKHVRTSSTEVVFLHPVGSTGHVVHSVASGARNVNLLFFSLRWAQCGFHKKCVGTRYAELLFFNPV
jgi:hypothetical protein